MPDLDRLRDEAERLGLELSDEDLAVIAGLLEPNRAELARLRPLLSQDGAFPYRFAPFRARTHD